jgi:hypothetical protein
MARKKHTALEAFELNMADAYFLADLAGGLTNQRVRRMNKVLRERVGEALKINGKRRERLDCVESEDFFVVLKPDTELSRERLKDVRPLLRQAVVAGSAAFETYVADRAMELVGPVLRRRPLPRRLGELSMTFEQYYDINANYERTAWGVRKLVGSAVTKQASPAPNQVGAVFAMVEEASILKRVDVHLKRPNTTSEKCLERLYERRNAIAHTGDRVGRGRADIDRAEVVSDLDELCRIANAIDTVTPAGR